MNKKINSLQNSTIKKLIQLRKTSKRKKEDLIVVEGLKEIGMAIESGVVIQTFFYCLEYTKKKPEILCKCEEMIEVSRQVFDKISIRENPDGYLAIAKPVYRKLDQIILSNNPLVTILESVEKPGNLGAILRTADAAGVDAVIICDPSTDIYNQNVIRASLGMVFLNQVVVTSTEKAQNWLTKKNITCYATTPEAQDYYTNIKYEKRAGIIVGAEHEGLSEKWLNFSKKQIKIPMLGKIDSLNASVSTAIVVYEIIKQRN